MDKIYFENQYAKVYFNKELNTVFLEYKSKVPSHQDFIEVNKNLIGCFEVSNTQKAVADIRKMGIIGLDSQQWVAEVLLPTMIKHLKGKALIHAQLLDANEIMSKVAANGVKQKTMKSIDNFELHQFSDRVELEKFLKSH